MTPAAIDQTRDETAIADEQWRMFTRALDAGHREYLEDAAKFERFYRGEQWDAEDLAKLVAEGRPALTINMVLPTINVVLGEQSGRRVEMQFKPADGATPENAFALTKMAMAIGDANDLPWVESTVFADGLIQDRGYFDVRMDFDDNLRGEVRITDLDPGDVVPDPDAKDYDPRKWNEVFITRWMSVEEIEETYGTKVATKLQNAVATNDYFGRDSIELATNTFGDTARTYVETSAGDKRWIKRVRVVERQYYKNTRIFSLINADGLQRELPAGTTKSEAEAIARKFGVFVYGKTKRKVRWRVTADHFVLHDEWSPYQTFTVVPYFPYFRRGKPFGVVRNLISPQEQLNKLSSQELHIVNTTANSGWVVERGALLNMSVDELKEYGSKTGVVLEVGRGMAGAVQKIKPNQIPSGIDRITQKSALNIREISGVNAALLGDESPEVSGVALESKETRGLVQMQPVLDSLARTRHLLARKVLELIQDFITEERTVFVTNEAEPGAPRVAMPINKVMPDGSVLNDVTTGKYDIVIGTMPTRDSFDEVQFAQALNLRNAGVMIPDYRVIQYSQLVHKDEIAEEVRSLTGLGEQSPEQQEMAMRAAMAELEKAEAEVAEKRAKVENLQSQSQLNVAKIVDMERDDERQLRELEHKTAMSRENNTLRQNLATLSAVNKLDTISLQAQTRPQPGANNGH